MPSRLVPRQLATCELLHALRLHDLEIVEGQASAALPPQLQQGEVFQNATEAFLASRAAQVRTQCTVLHHSHCRVLTPGMHVSVFH